MNDIPITGDSPSSDTPLLQPQRSWLERHETVIAVCLLLLAAFLRLAALSDLPASLNQDEASSGYEAWAILHYGMDRCGVENPVLLTSWGSGQNILYSWLDMPFIAVLGLNLLSLRLPAALLGVAAAAVFWRLARFCRGVSCGLAALLLITVNPWHIMACRWALESNIMPFFLLAGVFCTAKALHTKPAWLIGSGVCFALCLYAYGTSFFFLLLFLPLVLLRQPRLFREKWFWGAAALFVFLALPITLCQYINQTGGESMRFLGFTLPALTAPRQAAVSVLGTGMEGLKSNLKSLANLLITQSDGHRYNAIPGYGLFYFFGLPLTIIGICTSLHSKNQREQAVRLALLAGGIAACLITVNVNRVNMLWLPMLYFQAVALDWGIRVLPKITKAIPVLVLAVCFVLFAAEYTKGLQETSNLDGLQESLDWAEEHADGPVYVTDKIPAPYMLVLFLEQTPPAEFASTAVYNNPTSPFRNVVSYGNWRFTGAQSEARLYVVTRYEAASTYADCIEEAAFGKYVVCRPPDPQPAP